MSDSPSPNGSNGRDAGGRFTKGNAGGPGNPFAAHVGRLRSALINAVSIDDMKAIVGALVKKAKGGDVAAAKIVLERCLGRPIEHDLLERLEELEQFVAQMRNGVSHAA